MDGILLIDKPKGPSSFDVIKKVRALSRIKRVGHAGTLDPLASGLMIICLGKYTKLAGYLSQDHKTYEATITLGAATTTDDAEGPIISRASTDHLDAGLIHNACGKFRGQIEQLPPKFSAKKVQGVRAYRLARAQQSFDLVSRSVHISDLAITQVALPHVMIRVRCSSGTYIRSIARDLGAELAVGGFAQEIRRISSGAFDISQAHQMDTFDENNLQKHLLTGPQALGGLAKVELSSTDRENVLHGRRLSGPLFFEENCAIALYHQEPVAILHKQNGEIKVARGF